MIVGLVFGLREVIFARRLRRDTGSITIINALQTEEVRRAFGLILALADNTPPEEFKKDRALCEAAEIVSYTCETFGILVYERVVDLYLYNRMVGGFTIQVWNKLENYCTSERNVKSLPTYAEWFQWLVERLTIYCPNSYQNGAYDLFRGWKP